MDDARVNNLLRESISQADDEAVLNFKKWLLDRSGIITSLTSAWTVENKLAWMEPQQLRDYFDQKIENASVPSNQQVPHTVIADLTNMIQAYDETALRDFRSWLFEQTGIPLSWSSTPYFSSRNRDLWAKPLALKHCFNEMSGVKQQEISSVSHHHLKDEQDDDDHSGPILSYPQQPRHPENNGIALNTTALSTSYFRENSHPPINIMPHETSSANVNDDIDDLLDSLEERESNFAKSPRETNFVDRAKVLGNHRPHPYAVPNSTPPSAAKPAPSYKQGEQLPDDKRCERCVKAGKPCFSVVSEKPGLVCYACRKNKAGCSNAQAAKKPPVVAPPPTPAVIST